MAMQQQRYKILEKIAVGGMAEVFRAESAGLEGFKKTVAIKRVLPHLSEKKQFIGMFLDEARVSAHLSHSNCVQVFDVGVGDNTYFIVMEYVDGADLKGVIEHQRQRGLPLPVEETCFICVRICEGLTYAHELTDNRGIPLHIVHRDMSPPNVLITRYGEVKIVDFGLAKANSQLEKSEPGIIKGKFSYLSPEAAFGKEVDARTDIFAVGIILWEMLSGRRLFLGQTDLETVRQVQAASVPPIRQLNPAVPARLEQILAKALAGDPAQRYQTAREFGRDLNDVLFGFSRAVASFDIAALVEPIRVERERRKRSADRGSIIGSLIEEAMVEFTSLDGGGVSVAAAKRGSAPLRLDSFENVGDWAQDLDLVPEPSAPTMADQYQLGNLAALEDDLPAASKKLPPRASQSRPAPRSNTPLPVQRPSTPLPGFPSHPFSSSPVAASAPQAAYAPLPSQPGMRPSQIPSQPGTRPSQIPAAITAGLKQSGIAAQGKQKPNSTALIVAIVLVVVGGLVAIKIAGVF